MPEALILAADTTFGACSAALTRGAEVLARRFEVMARGHAEALAPMVDAVMREAGVGFAAIDRLAVTVGPGSFTGQRVGLAFMRALKVALKKPLIGVTSLAAMAEQARVEAAAEVGAAVQDAKRGEVYLETTAGHPAQILPLADAIQLLTLLPLPALAGTAAPLVAAALPSARVLPIIAPDAVWVAHLTAGREDSGAPRPLYLRPPDAKLPGNR